MNKLVATFGLLGIFTLGCATATVLVSNAGASPPSGSQQCAAFKVPEVNERHAERGQHNEFGLVLPVGWSAVGGTNARDGAAAVVACRVLP
jgi:hypothetical protein